MGIIYNFTMATSINFEHFTCTEEISSAGVRWKKYVQRFKNMLKAYKIDDNEQQKALLLHHAGEEIFEIFCTLPGNEEADFAKTVELLEAYFCPKKNEEYEVHKFRKAKQLEDESLDSFHTRLRKLAANCEFSDIDKEIKHQIIQKCKNKQLRIKALQDSLSLNNLLSMGRSMEMSAAQALEMEEKEVVYSTRKTRTPKYQKKICFRCGGNFPHKDRCPPSHGKNLFQMQQEKPLFETMQNKN